MCRVCHPTEWKCWKQWTLCCHSGNVLRHLRWITNFKEVRITNLTQPNIPVSPGGLPQAKGRRRSFLSRCRGSRGLQHDHAHASGVPQRIYGSSHSEYNHVFGRFIKAVDCPSLVNWFAFLEFFLATARIWSSPRHLEWRRTDFTALRIGYRTDSSWYATVIRFISFRGWGYSLERTQRWRDALLEESRIVLVRCRFLLLTKICFTCLASLRLLKWLIILPVLRVLRHITAGCCFEGLTVVVAIFLL